MLHEGDRVFFGRNLDWDWEEGLIFINQRNVQKRAFVASENAAAWTSKYGSVTFNQFGHEMPFGGMNEAGLVVECMWLDGTEYPQKDTRPEINLLQWIQYQLDTHQTVEEVIQSDRQVRLEHTPLRAWIHYLVSDASGDCAAIEFLNGRMRVQRGAELPYKALANDTYAKSAKRLRTQPVHGDLSQPLTQTDSLDRFCRAAVRAAAYKPAASPTQDVAYAFETLKQVRQGNYTVWQIVYDVTARQIHFRTRSNSRIRLLDLKTFDFGCAPFVLCADIRSRPSPDGRLPFDKLNELEHGQHLKRFAAKETVKDTVGDFAALVDPLMRTVQTYKCADN